MGVIYLISSPSGKRYIGSAKRLDHRRAGHLRALRSGRHHNCNLQRAWKKYDGRLVFSVLLVCREEDLYFYEQLCLDHLSPEYNISPSAFGTRGLKWSNESKEKLVGRKVDGALISAGMLASTTSEQRRTKSIIARSFWTAESQAKQIAKLTGKKHSDETKNKRIAHLIGRNVSYETRKKIAAQKGWKHTEEAKQKMRGRTRSQDHRDKLSASLKGTRRLIVMPHSAETKHLISASLKGRKRSSEAIAKHRATMASRRALNSVDYEVK